jgi:hypothetical protein
MGTTHTYRSLKSPKRVLRACSTLVTSIFLLAASCGAQTSAPLSSLVMSDTLGRLRDDLQEKQNDRGKLERMLAALNSVDTVYKTHCPTWTVLDEDLRQRILRILRLQNPGAVKDTVIVVIANPEETQILELTAGSVTMGRRDARVNLGDSLHFEILHGEYAKRIVDTSPIRPRNPMLFGYTPRFAALSLSGFGATLLFNDGLGVNVKLGHEELGYHFWSTGSLKAMAMFEQLKLGIIAPFTFGNTQPDRIAPLTIRPRKLTGTKGIAIEYDYPFASEQVSAILNIGEVPSAVNSDLLVDRNAVYSIHTVSQLTYARQEFLGGGRHMFTLRGGIGYHQVATGTFMPDGTLATTNKEDFVSPIVAVDYVHHGDRLYGMGIQYYSSVIFATCWIEFVKDFIFVDLKYYSPVFRNPKPWEQPYFFMISPRIQVIY